MKNQNKKKCVLLLLIGSLMLTLFTGCDVKDKEKKAIVKELKNQDILQIGEKEFNDYSKTYTVSNGPVPGATRYYDYEVEGGTVQVRFYKWKDEGKQYYSAQLREQKDDMDYNTSYTFQKTVTGRMRLLNKSVISLTKSFDAGQKYGITQIVYSNSKVILKLKKDNSKVVDQTLYSILKDGIRTPEKAPKVFCNIDGIVHEAESTKYKEQSDSYVISAKLAGDVEGDILSWQVGNIILDIESKKVVSMNSVY